MARRLARLRIGVLKAGIEVHGVACPRWPILKFGEERIDLALGRGIVGAFEVIKEHPACRAVWGNAHGPVPGWSLRKLLASQSGRP